MGLESGNYISDLVTTNPTSGDAISQGDDHLRLIKDILKKSFPGFASSILITGTDTGSANAYAIAPTVAVPAYVAGMIVMLKPANANTGGSTLNVSSLGAKTLKRRDGTALQANDLPTTSYTLFVYNGTDFIMIGSVPTRLNQFALFSNEQTQGTGGGQAAGGVSGTYYKVPINTEKYNTITGATLTSSVIQLPAGTYHIDVTWCRLSSPGSFSWERARLRNTSDNTDIIIGQNFPDDNVFQTVFTLTGTKNLELQFATWTTFTPDGNDFGEPISAGGTEIYGYVSIERLY